MAVWLLPGQGAQAPCMGAGVVGDAAADEVFAVGSEVLGVDVRYLALEAGRTEVDDAFNAQVLAAAVSIACGRALLARGVRPDAFIGFSLGQISALALSGMLSLEDAFSLLKVRATAMAQACRDHDGAMLALVGASLDEAEEMARRCASGDVLVVANHNCPGQKVLSGTAQAIARCEEHAAECGFRAVRLNTAGAFHSPLMHDAAQAVHRAACELGFSQPCAPVICNTDARPFTAEEAPERLARQVESPVLFEESVAALIAQGSDRFVEVGCGKVLSGLMRKIDRGVVCERVGTIAQADEFARETEKELR